MQIIVINNYLRKCFENSKNSFSCFTKGMTAFQVSACKVSLDGFEIAYKTQFSLLEHSVGFYSTFCMYTIAAKEYTPVCKIDSMYYSSKLQT